MEQYEQYYRLPQDVVGHDAALLSYWDRMPAKAQLRLLESDIVVLHEKTQDAESCSRKKKAAKIA